ncbi:MAG: beta-lactamase family protein, partial [Nitrospinae bacterium]|nr:beta-lactamase family protein [Nitrospinota bacterium]
MSVADIRVEGHCHSDFSVVEEEFRENFASRGEIGAAVCVYKDGEKVVDLWGGHRDEARTQTWTKDTIVLMSSIAKSITALSVHMLVDRG